MDKRVDVLTIDDTKEKLLFAESILDNQRATIEKLNAELGKKIQELIVLKQANNYLENVCMEDGLTSIANRRFIDQYLLNQWKSCKRYNMPFSVVMIDLDNFKNYNDNYGHINGDKVLVNVAKALEGTVRRPEDVVGRYGGEEFIVILPDTGEKGAAIVAEKLKNAIKKLKISHNYNANFNYVTVSLGVATALPGSAATVNDIVDAADKALYLAKTNGRNHWEATVV